MKEAPNIRAASICAMYQRTMFEVPKGPIKAQLGPRKPHHEPTEPHNQNPRRQPCKPLEAVSQLSGWIFGEFVQPPPRSCINRSRCRSK